MEFPCEPRLPAPSVSDNAITVDAPPDIPKSTPANPLARMMPVVMIVATVGMTALYFNSGATVARSPVFMFFPVMMLISAIGSLTFAARGNNHTAEVNADRRAYLGYLEALEDTVATTATDQRRSLHWTHPHPDVLWTLVGGRRMWERTADDDDFCEVRVGLGERPLSTALIAPELRPVDEQDPVTSSALTRLMRQSSVVAGLPITVHLARFSVVTIEGDVLQARALLRAMVCQLTVFHSPEHIRIAAIVGREAKAEWDWLKWLPHHQHPQLRDAVGPARLVFSSLAEAYTTCVPPDRIGSPHAVFILDGVAPAGMGSVEGATVVQVGTSGEHASSGKCLRLQVDGDNLRPDGLSRDQALMCARRLAPYRPTRSSGGVSRAAEAAAWFELMGLDGAGIDPSKCWNDRSDRDRLRVPIGVSVDGDPVTLDIKESARNGMGPHGLCVGATGSGKSEFLRTLTLGMITAHSPDVLNLILVDFKGGATFLGFERARHVAAVITNLAEEAHLVARMHDALSGEMNRRQELLRAAGNYANVAEYEHARSAGRDLQALPALFIIVDEFSELLSQHPDFAELFVAIGRVGRSLGMHLLLASQRLDEGRLRGLETHLSYRICLKTFSASESRAVLGVPDAHHLPSTPGAAYLKTASGELLRFQTAFVSGPDVSDDDVVPESTEPAIAREFTAAPVGPIPELKGPPTGRTDGPSRTVLDAVLNRLADRGSRAHPVWLPPLRESPTLDFLMTGEEPNLAVPVGVVDCPYEQRRERLMVELSGADGNVAIVGGPRSGKSMALRTLVMAMANTHHPAAVQFYCLDFGGGALTSLRRLPHVGAVAGRLEVDLCRRTVADVESVVRAREARFRRLGIDSIADYRRRRSAGDAALSDDPYGDVFLVIDGWAAFRQEFDNLEPSIIALASQGLSFGVHVVVTASRWAEMRPALKDQIGTRIELRLGDPADSEMDRRRARQLNQMPPGHGITREGREMVIALPRVDGQLTTSGLGGAIDAAAERLNVRWGGRRARPVELLPTRIHRRDVGGAAAANTATEILIGLGERELAPVALDFAEQPHLVVLGEAECGKTSALRMLCREIVRTNDAGAAQVEIIDFRRSLLGVVESEHLLGYSMSAPALASRLPTLLDQLVERMPGPNVTQQQLRWRSWWSGPEIYVVIDDYDLVAGASGNPLMPLVDYLPHAKDLGLHVIVARRSGGAARAMFDPFLARLRDLGAMGLMMSASPEEGILLGSVRPCTLPPGRGTLIARGHADQLIQVAWTEQC
ncbi:type VII secretion protein EccCa [Mycobacterium sp. MMS18-G62]